MAANNRMTSNYPKLESAWQENLPQIDQQIVGFCETCVGAPMQHIAELQEHIENWLEDQDLDDDTLAEFQRVKKDPQYLEDKLGKRVGQLNQQGRIVGGKPLSMQAAGGGPRQGPTGRQSASAGSGAGEYPPKYPPEFKPGSPATPHPAEPGSLPSKGPQADRNPRDNKVQPPAPGKNPTQAPGGKPQNPKAN